MFRAHKGSDKPYQIHALIDPRDYEVLVKIAHVLKVEVTDLAEEEPD